MSILLRCLSVLALFTGAAQAAMPADLGQRLLVDYIRPATTQLAVASSELGHALPAYCAAPAAAPSRTVVEQRFAALVAAWARVEPLRFGPLLEDNRFERFFFFPDPRGVTLRQVQALLAAADPAALTAGALRSRSVAVQGLPALEYALYGNDAKTQIAADTTAGRYRCAYAVAVVANLSDIAEQIRKAWSPDGRIAREFAAPSATQALYRNTDEVATETLKALSTGWQYTRDIKLLPALGATPEAARGQRAPLWRSGLTQAALAASTTALLDFYSAARFGTALPADSRWIDDSLRSESVVAIADFQAVSLPFEQAVTDADSREHLVHAALVLKNIQAVVVEYLAPALSINLGFNALDGD